MDNLLTVRDIAAQLNIAVSTVYRLIEDGTLNVIRIGAGRSIRMKQEYLNLYIASLENNHG